MKFIGRQSELQTLEQEYRRDGGFVVIYGRRRVGKTRLIKEFIKDKPAVYFLATEEVEAQSMKRMAGVIARATGGGLVLGVLLAWVSPSGKRLLAYGRQSYEELRRVVWPTKKETLNTTGLVMAFVVVMAFFLFVVDKLIELGLYDGLLRLSL